MVKRDIRLICLFFFICSCTTALRADITTIVDSSDFLSLVRLYNGSFGFVNFLQNYLDFLSEGNENVKGEFELETIVSDKIQLLLPRAYVKIRFPGFRITAGITRVSWGDGFLFNAGDVIFGSLSLPTSLVNMVLRDQTDFLCSVYVPLDRFAFFEAVLLPHPVSQSSPSGAVLPFPVDPAAMSYGGRIAGKIAGVTCETGYLHRGADQHHLPYVSFHGNLIADWNISASADIPFELPAFDSWKENIAVTAGLFYLLNFEEGGSLSLRLESAVYPFGALSETDTPQTKYLLYLYPEIAYAPAADLSFIFRSILSPIDLSGIILSGVNWNIYQGFTFSFLFSAMFGDSNDYFGWGRTGDLAFTVSLRYIFGTDKPAADEKKL